MTSNASESIRYRIRRAKDTLVEAQAMAQITMELPSVDRPINHVTIFLKLPRGLVVSTNSGAMTAMITGIYLQLVPLPRL